MLNYVAEQSHEVADCVDVDEVCDAAEPLQSDREQCEANLHLHDPDRANSYSSNASKEYYVSYSVISRRQ